MTSGKNQERSDHFSRSMRRLEEIARALAQTGHARALIGYGSTAEIDRFDQYSDLDFLVIAGADGKEILIRDTRWFADRHPVIYCTMHTDDGFRVVYDDGVLCDFGVVEETDLPGIAREKGRLIWSETDFDHSACGAVLLPVTDESTPERHLGEVLWNLHVGLLRYARGEKLAAYRDIQEVAVRHLLHLVDGSPRGEIPADPFVIERRYESRHPDPSRYLPHFLPGYEASPEAVLNILSFLEQKTELPEPFVSRIRRQAEALRR